MVEENPLSVWPSDTQISFVEKEHKRFIQYRKRVKRGRWRDRDAASYRIYKLLQARRLSKEPSLYAAYMFHTTFPRHMLSDTAEMHHCLYMLHLFFIVTDLASQIWILSSQELPPSENHTLPNMILRMQSLGTQVKRPLSFQSDPSPRIRGTQSLGSSSNIYYHLFLTWTLHNLCHFPASQPPSASTIQLLKVTASLSASSVTATQCVQHTIGTAQGGIRFISMPWSTLGSCIRQPTQQKLAKNHPQMKESMNLHI